MTTEAYLLKWLAHMKGRVRAVTYDGYEALVRVHAIPGLGSIPLTSARRSRRIESKSSRGGADLRIAQLYFPMDRPPPAVDSLRSEVRSFLQDEQQAGRFTPVCDSWNASFSPDFSRKLAQHGWLGMTWPRMYGGHERSAVERFVVVEELLAAGAPVAAHWIADRQTGPMLLKYGTEQQRKKFLPAIAAGECYFAIGMSEADSGSDLASVRTRAIRRNGGWRITGNKIWTSHAHQAHYSIVFCRTSSREDDRHSGGGEAGR